MTVAALISELAKVDPRANVFVSVGFEFSPMEPDDIELDGDGDVLLGDTDGEDMLDEELIDDEEEESEVL